MLLIYFFQTPEDGDCLYTALLAPMMPGRDQYDQRDLRRMLGMYMLKHKEEVYPLIEPILKCDGCSFRRYVYNTITEGIWGDAGNL